MRVTEIITQAKEALQKLTLDVKIVGDTFTDDHIVCCNVTVNDVPLEVMWCGAEFVGAVTYMSESESAKKDVVEFFMNCIDGMIENVLDEIACGTDVKDINEYGFLTLCGLVENDFKSVTD